MPRILQYQSKAGPQLTSFTERTTPDKWQPQTNAPEANFRKLSTYSLAALAPALFFANIFPAATIPNTAAFQQNPNPVVRTVNTAYLERASAPQDPTSMRDRTIWVDKLQITNQYLHFPDVKRWQYLYPSVAFNPNPLPVSAFLNPWHNQPAQILSPAKPLAHLYPSYATDPRSLTQKETVSLDRFQQPQSLPRWDVQRSQWLYPSFSINPQALTQAERATPDKWQPATNQPVFDAKRQQQIYPATGAYTRNPVTEIVTTDKWHPITNRPVFDVKRWQHLYQTWATDPKHLLDKETIIVAKWFRETQQPLFDVKRWQFLYPYLSIDTKFFVKPPFYRDKYTPQGNSFSDKFSSKGTSYSDKYSAKGSAYSDKYSPRNL